jgi:hypothetical protein
VTNLPFHRDDDALLHLVADDDADDFLRGHISTRSPFPRADQPSPMSGRLATRPNQCLLAGPPKRFARRRKPAG